MTLTWKDPGDARLILTPAVVADLRANPGRWALLRTYNYRHGGGCRTFKRPTDIELRLKYSRTRTELYARAK